MASMVIKGLNHCSTFKNTVQKIVLELSFLISGPPPFLQLHMCFIQSYHLKKASVSQLPRFQCCLVKTYPPTVIFIATILLHFYNNNGSA